MKFISGSETLYRYVESHALLPSDVLADLAQETSTHTMARMQIPASQGGFMHLLAKSIGARRALEVGCFTGYSAIAVASALPKDGELHTLDIDPEATAIAKRYFVKAGLAQRIHLHLAPGLQTLALLADKFGTGWFDFMFIDADKGGMIDYYERGLSLVRPGGLILADNVLWSGRVIDSTDHSQDTEAIRRFNQHVRHDKRVDSTMLPMADGIFLARVR